MLPIDLDRGSGVPLARQIAAAVRSGVEAGRLEAGSRLPAERALARSLGVDRMTVARAYEELVTEGLVERQVGRGSFVRRPGSPERDAPAVPPGPARWRRAMASATVDLPAGSLGLLNAPAPGNTINLSSLFPDPSLFPLDEFRRAINTVLSREGVKLLGYGSAAGYAPLRRYVAESMARTGAPVLPDQIVITNGSQQGIDLVARTLLDPGDRVVLEDPTYAGAVQVFQAHGARPAGVGVDEEGMIPEELDALLERSAARLIYLIPNFQNPTSATMGLRRRREILEVALRRGVPVLEDDFGGDLRYEGEEVPSLRSLDRNGEGVIYLSTFAKKLVPGLRIGWLAAPGPVVERLVAIKRVTDWSTSFLLQGALHEFCVRGHMERHMDRAVGIYRRRRDAMLESMTRHFPEEVRWSRPRGGLVIWVTLPGGISAEEVAVEARAQGVLVSSGEIFSVRGGSRSNLRLVFGQAGAEAIRKGVKVLGAILHRKMEEARAADLAGEAESLPVL